MPKINGESPDQLLRRALIGLDAQIAELQEKRAQLAALVEPKSTVPTVAAVAPRQQRRMSAEARAKISVAAKARWAKAKKTQAKKQQPKPLAKKARAKVAKTKKATTKKGKAMLAAGT